MKKITAILLSLLLIVSLCGCNSSGSSESTSSDTSPTASIINVAFCNNDRINPYKCETEYNYYLSALLFDPLVKINENFEAEFFIAESISLQEKVRTVKIKNVNFTDGSPVTADDIVYSTERAKESVKFSEQLSNILSCTRVDDRTVKFVLDDYDVNFQNLLTYPIIKKDSGDNFNSSKLEIPPIGCGKYILDKENGQLKANEAYYKGAAVNKTINLIHTPDDEALISAINNNKITLWYSHDADKNSIVLNGGSISSNKNNLVYLGINLTKAPFNIPEFRYALNLGLNRETIVTRVFQNYALASNGIFNPKWSAVSSIQKNPTKGDNNIFVANLKEIGYNGKDNEGFYISKNGKRLSLNLLYCNESTTKERLSNEIVSQFKSLGIEVIAQGKSYNDYITALTSKSFDIYIGETRFLNNMDISELVSENGKINYGSPLFNNEKEEPEDDDSLDKTEDVKNETEDLYNTMSNVLSDYNQAIAEHYDVIETFNIIMPIIPICYENGIISWQKGVSGVNPYYIDDPYHSLSTITVNK